MMRNQTQLTRLGQSSSVGRGTARMVAGSFLLALVVLSDTITTSWSFSLWTTSHHRPANNRLVAGRTSTTTELSSQSSSRTSASRRDWLSTVAWTTASIVSSTLVQPIAPAAAVGGISKVNDKLRGLGLPTYASVPDGFTPLCEIYGKGKNRFPLLVTFAHPLTWVVTIPSNDANGEDGTVQAGEYAKGDTATFFVYSKPGHVDDIHSASKELIEQTLIKAISQKGDNMYQNFKVTKTEPITLDGQKYVRADFKYQLLTGAGFEVDRKGVASITSQGPAVEALWAASTTQRYKKTEQQLRNIVSTFRCYADGINFSEELFMYD